MDTTILELNKKSISHQLELILASPDLDITQKQIAFLKFVVNRTLSGKGCEINEATVAKEVFGRGPNFDQSIDPIVSIQASRLRLALARYYQNSGKNDPIRIDIPVGTCVPVFKKQ